MIQRLHKLSPLLSFMFVRYSSDLIVHLLQGGRGRVSGSEVISCSHIFQYLCWNRLWCSMVLDTVVISGEDVWSELLTTS